MYVRLPDPNPGRCENYRSVMHSDGRVETLRCLDYEGTKHICEFPEPLHIASDPRWGGNSYSYSEKHDRPQPWVKPQNDAVSHQNDAVFMGGGWR